MNEPRKFRWEQCYEMCDGEIHWALKDTATDADSAADGCGGRVTCAYMVLLQSCPHGLDGRPLDQQVMPALIVELLNKHFANSSHD